MNKVKEDFFHRYIFSKLNKIKASSPRLKNFFGILNRVEDDKLAVFGGAARDWWLGYNPKDIDIVIDSSPEVLSILSSNFEHTKSKFEGYQFDIDGTKIDLWQLKDSWYFKRYVEAPSWETLVNTVPFDIDAIMVFKSGKVLDHGFTEAVNAKQIELKNRLNKNFEKFVLERALRFKDKYNFTLGPKLQKEIDNGKLPNYNNTIQNPCGEIPLRKPSQMYKKLDDLKYKKVESEEYTYGSSN